MNATAINKTQVLEAFRERIDVKLRELVASQKTAQAGAIHEETRQEDPKDTRAIEAQYLARGLADRVEALRDTQANLAALRLKTFQPGDRIALTALVVVIGEDENESLYFLAPPGCSERLEVGGNTIHVLTSIGRLRDTHATASSRTSPSPG